MMETPKFISNKSMEEIMYKNKEFKSIGNKTQIVKWHIVSKPQIINWRQDEIGGFKKKIGVLIEEMGSGFFFFFKDLNFSFLMKSTFSSHFCSYSIRYVHIIPKLLIINWNNFKQKWEMGVFSNSKKSSFLEERRYFSSWFCSYPMRRVRYS